MPYLRFLLKVSRPRFWLYLFGPYIVGIAAAGASRSDFIRTDVIVFGLYFLFPANLLIYGINDIFDFETDKLNPKKVEYEALVSPENHSRLLIAILVLNLPFITASALLGFKAFPLMLGFLILFCFLLSSAPYVPKQGHSWIPSSMFYISFPACSPI